MTSGRVNVSIVEKEHGQRKNEGARAGFRQWKATFLFALNVDSPKWSVTEEILQRWRDFVRFDRPGNRTPDPLR